MHFFSAVQVPLSATIMRGATSSVPEMVLSSMHPPASSHGNERAWCSSTSTWAGLRCRWGQAEVWNLLTKDGERSRGLALPPGGPLQCSARTGLGGRALGGGLLVSVPCAIGKINTVKSACVVCPFSELLIHSKAMWLFLSSLLTAAVPELCSGHQGEGLCCCLALLNLVLCT